MYDKKLADSLIKNGFRLEIASVPDLPYFASLVVGVLISASLLFRLIRGKHDIVIEDGWIHPTALLFNIVCRLTRRTRLVIIVHQVRWSLFKPPLTAISRTAERVSLSSAELIVAVSRFIRQEVELLVGSSDRTIVASPGSHETSSGLAVLRNPDQRLETSNVPLRLLFVGNCTRLKGLEYLIHALALLRDLPLELDVVGGVNFEPRYSEKVRRLARRLNVHERVTFHGAVSHESLGHFYSKADIFTFPSLYEGFGIVLAEAMHAGLPIVATKVGPIDEIVREGENALVVPPADAAALAGAIKELAADPTTRTCFGRRSRELAKQLPTWEKSCDYICSALNRDSQASPRSDA